jgi:hypothetical protein
LKLLEVSWSVDPRLGLVLALGIELRGGQVVRGLSSDLDLEKDRLMIYGAGKKKGTLVKLTKGQRAAVDRAMHPETGYLRELEAAYQAKSIADYTLIPAGQFRGIRVFRRGRPSQAKFESWKPPEHPSIPIERHASLRPASPTALRKWFRSPRNAPASRTYWARAVRRPPRRRRLRQEGEDLARRPAVMGRVGRHADARRDLRRAGDGVRGRRSCGARPGTRQSSEERKCWLYEQARLAIP